MNSSQPLSFRILDQLVEVDCTFAPVAKVVASNFEAMSVARGAGVADLRYLVTGRCEVGPFKLIRHGRAGVVAESLGDLLFLLEKDITVSLQLARSELLFLHSAALEHGGRAWLLAGDSGNGKSTTTWGLLHHDFRYMSDELCAIDLASQQVLAYPHALCLKRTPPARFPLPADVLGLGDTIHVPVRALPAQAVCRPCPPAAVLFVRYQVGLVRPELRKISPAEAGARLYAVTLNALAHPSRGLDAVSHLAERVLCYSLDCGELHLTCDRISQLVAEATPQPA